MTPTMTDPVTRNFKAPVGANMTVTEEANPDYRVKTSGKTMPSGSEGSSITDEDTDNANVFVFQVTDDGAAIIYENERAISSCVRNFPARFRKKKHLSTLSLCATVMAVPPAIMFYTGIRQIRRRIYLQMQAVWLKPLL